MNQDNEKRSAFERHAQTAMNAVVVALMGWAGSTLIDVRDRLTRIEAIKQSEVSLDSLRDGSTTAFRTEVLTYVRDHEARIRTLEVNSGGKK